MGEEMGEARHRRAVREEYDRLAKSYDRRWSRYVEASVRETLSRLPDIEAPRVLDIGCGTGALLGAIGEARPGARLCGVDPTEAMLAVARRRLPEGVELVQGWAERLPFSAGAFDLVVSSSMFHYVRDPSRALAQVRRVLVPGGALVVTDWCDDFLACRICDRVLRVVNRAHHRIYTEAECTRLLRAGGFEGLVSERYKISWLWGFMTVRAWKPGPAPP